MRDPEDWMKMNDYDRWMWDHADDLGYMLFGMFIGFFATIIIGAIVAIVAVLT